MTDEGVAEQRYVDAGGAGPNAQAAADAPISNPWATTVIALKIPPALPD